MRSRLSVDTVGTFRAAEYLESPMRRLGIAPLVPLVLLACGGPAATSLPSSTPGQGSVATATPTAPPPVNAAAIVATIRTAEGPMELAATQDAVWVENHRSNIVSRIDPAQNLEIERLTEANVHCDVAAGGSFVWATEAAADSLKKIDAATGDVIDSIVLADACGVAADVDDVWVTSPGEGTVVRYAANNGELLATIEVAPLVFVILIGREAVWVSGEMDGGNVYRIDPAANEVVATISVPSPFAHGLAEGFGAVWASARENQVIYRIDPATNAVTTTIEMPSLIGGIAVGPDAVWTTGFGDGTVYRIDPEANQITARVETGLGNLGPVMVAFDSVWLSALDQNVVVRIDPAAIK
jgi:DNA-binding beta-propeller fold protein YncE